MRGALARFVATFEAGKAKRRNTYHGVIASMVAAIEDKESALHVSCVTMRAAGTRLLVRAQSEGKVRRDIEAPVSKSHLSFCWVVEKALSS